VTVTAGVGHVESHEPSSPPAAIVPLLLLFAASGCAALIYEIVWFQLLQLVIGSSAVSLGLLLAAYMGGLCLGSALLPRFVSARHHPLRVYGFLEAGIAAFGLIALFGVPLVARIYVAGATTGLLGWVLRGAVAAACLLPPTLLMGASLPAIARWVETTPRGISRLGFLYSANIAGAVIGCLAAGFYLLRVYDIAVATYVAAAMNVAVALVAFRLAKARAADHLPVPVSYSPAIRSPIVYIAIALSGLTALGAEVVWTRLLSLMLGATVYTFSIILAVFLMGLWAGSGAGSYLARRTKDPRLAFAACQVLLAAGIAWTAFMIGRVLPYWPVDPALALNPWFLFDLDVTSCLHAILPATLLWGASFPLALAAARFGESPSITPDEDAGQLAGEVYAANTLGSIIGALAFSLILIPAIGTSGSERWLIGLAALSAAIALMGAGRRILLPGLAVIAAAGWAFSATVPEVPWQAIAYGRRVAPKLRGGDANLQPEQPVFVGEGISSSVAITQRGEQRFFFVAGKSEASSAPIDMRLQRMMGHIPALFQSSPRSVLVVGFGAGVTAGSFVPYPEVQRIVICELEPLIPPASDEFFGKENYHVLQNPRTTVVYDDARHYILTTPEKFDVITTDPIHPWVKGTSTLYSKEYYELVKSHLSPHGVAAQWLPLYESDEETVKTEFATFFSVFPHATVWSNFLDGDGYDLVLIGRPDDSPIDADEIQRRLNRPDYSKVVESLSETGFPTAMDLLATYAGRAPDLQPMLEAVRINEDMNLRLQYLAGLGLNSVAAPGIYREMLGYRKFPEDLLRGEKMDVLRTQFGRPQRSF
jgi:spermidine synthase